MACTRHDRDRDGIPTEGFDHLNVRRLVGRHLAALEWCVRAGACPPLVLWYRFGECVCSFVCLFCPLWSKTSIEERMFVLLSCQV